MRLFPLFLAAAAPAAGQVSLDAHVHVAGVLAEGSGARAGEALAAGAGAERAILISPAYLVDDDGSNSVFADAPNKGRGVERPEPLDLQRRLDRETAAAAAAAPERFLGACGLPGRALDAGARAAALECLDLPGMSGLKFRAGSGESLRAAAAGVTRIAAEAGDRLRFVLMHLATYEHTRRDPEAADYAEWTARDRAEIDAFVDLAAAHPNVQFILAHSAFGPAMLDYYAQRAAAAGLDNHWTEVSHIIVAARDAPLTVGAIPDPARFDCAYAESWRRFGVGRVLFGSDRSTRDGAGAFDRHVEAVRGNACLRGPEKEAILRLSGLTFWETAAAP